MNKETGTFSFNPPINLVQEGKWFLGVTSFEAINSVFKLTNKNIIFSTTIPGHWNSKSGEIPFDELNKVLELRSQNDINLHIDEVRKKC